MKRILTVQDISCVGKCSLTVALPIISAMGVECSILPTAVLSTHTGFPGFTFDDLTDQIEPVSRHWKEQGLGFDAIYTGYLGTYEQLDLVSSFFDAHRGEGPLLRGAGDREHALAAATVLGVVGDGGALAVALVGDHEQVAAAVGDLHP